MNIYIDESGSINNHSKHNKFFIIALVHVKDRAGLKKAYKRFVSSNFDRLLALDNDKIDSNTGKIVKYGGKMFTNGRFKELKGSQFDREMKSKFIDFFSRNKTFEVYYIKINNNKLTDNFCENTARVFNYTLKLALEYFNDYIITGGFPEVINAKINNANKYEQDSIKSKIIDKRKRTLCVLFLRLGLAGLRLPPERPSLRPS